MALTVVIVLIVILIDELFFKKNDNNQKLLSPVTDFVSTGSSLPSHTAFLSANSLETAVQNVLAGAQGNYAIAIFNLETAESYYFAQHQSFQSASLYKLWIMATVYDQIQTGILQENDVLSQNLGVLDRKFLLASDSAQQRQGTITLAVSDALNNMITLSDNDSALLLTERIRLSKVALFLERYDFSESMVGLNGEIPTTTASDIAIFFKKLYEGQLTNPENTEKMLDLLKQQKLNEKLPKYLPSNIVIAHKTGELEDYSHDAGIVYSNDGDYVIVVLSKSDMPAAANEIIAAISASVYNYFSRNE